MISYNKVLCMHYTCRLQKPFCFFTGTDHSIESNSAVVGYSNILCACMTNCVLPHPLGNQIQVLPQANL